MGCEQRTVLAPVVQSQWWDSNSTVTQHRVVAGETLYAIAFRYDKDYRQLAAINHIPSPYHVTTGQMIYLKKRPTSAPRPRSKPHSVTVRRSKQERQTPQPAMRKGHWIWPARGVILTSFAPAKGRKGMDIGGRKGRRILATAGGTVAYAGDGLPGYGNLILIKHPNQLLSAYGYNAQNLVHEGQTIRAGQAIATMGQSPHHRYAVHFEIRKAGKAVNPKSYLR